MRALDSVGILHSGREGDVASWTVEGHRVALIAFSPNIGAHMLDDYVRVEQLVRALAAAHDIVIVSFHGGAEGVDAAELTFADETYQDEPRGNVVRFAHLAVDSGADLVLGHGPHVPRALELYNGRLIAYSLGNFATYYGVSVDDAKGFAPLLRATLAPDGHFLEGSIESMVQVRPGGPRPDPERHALTMMRELTEKAFGTAMLRFNVDGAIRPP
jgi:poly-gamma-glutamate capsule biosynthesis protein CapA/YwtB (metallophosphatase superfamily)